MTYALLRFLIIFRLFECFFGQGDLLEDSINYQSGINVVIFFAHSNRHCEILQKESLKCLNLREISKVKIKPEDQEIAECKKTAEICKDLLKSSLHTLTHFCHSVMNMKTAEATVSSKQVIENIENTSEAKIIESRHSRSEESKQKYPNSKRIFVEKENNEISNSKNVITGTKHTEVFQIRVKRKVNFSDDKNEIKIIEDYPQKKRCNNKNPWDVLDVMKHIRYSFLGNLLEKNAIDGEDLVDVSKLGQQMIDPGLFSTTKSTLDTLLLDNPGSNFLMIIFGGHLHSIMDKHSPLVQSVKYTLENTDPEKTITILTGSCTDGTGVTDNFSIPVYVRGPNTDILSESKLLYDIPLILKKILEVHADPVNRFVSKSSNRITGDNSEISILF
ncbi:hypothetical protein ABEB36_010401 [Hypothenemus hampei]|uniref:Uncharacterized protein n=1 Tax=Hypothenemus hampei TaxID=57062 RepID=A0ABD1EJK2_HYPHA